MRRRTIIALGAAGLLAGRARAALPDRAVLLAPGPAESPLARLAERLAEALPPLLPSALRLSVSLAGGPDGLAAAVRFAAGAEDASLLLLPGRAAAARLAGDPRARFDGAGWGGVLLRPRRVVLAGRGAAGAPGARLAMEAPESAEALGLLLVEGLQPRLGLPPAAVPQAYAEGAVDALFTTPEGAAALGATVWLALPPPGGAVADTAAPALAAACRAASAALTTEAALCAAALTPADRLAAWRWGAARLAEREAGLLAGAEAMAGFAALWPGEAAEAAWRAMLSARLGPR
ncbi:MAG: hypothetical protein N2Z67_07845 [Acetobacteraceae bacterium]|nr:hypothetical protein [Acetobacteraceae bacterium]